MLNNNLRIAVRNLRKYKGFSALNILGLAVSLTAALFMFLWVRDELSYDTFHPGADRIYAVLANVPQGGGALDTWMGVPYPLREALTSKYPEIELAAGFEQPNERYLKADNKTFIETGTAGSPALFELFNFPFVKSNWHEAFAQPGSLVVSEALAAKLYGKDWASLIPGAALEIDQEKYTVTGVFKDIPANSSIQFDYVFNLDERMKKQTDNTFPWGNFDNRTFVRLAKHASGAAVSEKIASAIADNNKHASGVRIWLHPLPKLHLWSNFENGQVAGGRIEYVRIFGAAALFLLLIACINFMNLATAQASRRAKEVGVRKTIGATRSSLMLRFLSEAALITFISVGIAVLLVEILLPQFRVLTGKALHLDYSDPVFWGMLAGIYGITSLLAGSYPAFFLSSFDAMHALKSETKAKWSGQGLRQGLVVFQFILSGLLIICALVVYQQIQYIQTKNLGLDRENVIHFGSSALGEKFELFKTEALRNSSIKSLTPVSGNPLDVGMATGDPVWEGKRPGEGGLFNIINADHDFLETFHIQLAQGRNFSREMSTDSMAFLVNETAVKFMGLDNPLGNRLTFWGKSGPIVGVVKDFHINSLHVPIGPAIVRISPQNTWTAFARIEAGKDREAIAYLEATFKKFAPGIPFEYDYLDVTYRKTYATEIRTGQLAGVFALLAAFISCLGLFGLAAFTVETRTKEIGIRKVLGATTPGIVALLSRGFLRPVLIALLIAVPFAWYAVGKWLDDFAYRVDVHWSVFALAGVLMLVVALLTVSVQSIKAALANPMESLRNP